eukprot:865424_1
MINCLIWKRISNALHTVFECSSIVIHPCYEQRFKSDISELLISMDTWRQRIYATCECVDNNVFVALSLGRACLSHLGLNKGFSDAALYICEMCCIYFYKISLFALTKIKYKMIYKQKSCEICRSEYKN